MKRLSIRVLTFACAAGMMALAQTSTAEIGASYGSSIAIPGFLPPVVNQSDPSAYWATTLGLDAGQQASIKSILTDEQNATNTLTASLSRALAALNAAAKTNTADPELERLAADLGSLFAQAVAVQAKAFTKFYSLLRPDQKQKFDQLATLPPGASLAVFGSATGPGASTQTVKH